MNKANSKDILDSIAMIFGNQEYRELGKEKSEWFKKIFNALENDEPGFLEFLLFAELRCGEIIAKEELLPTTSLLVLKARNKIKQKRKESIINFFNSDEFDNYCKKIFFNIKEEANNGNK